MHYIFVHPEGENVSGVFTFGCHLHEGDPRCLTLLLEPADSKLSVLDRASPRVRVLKGPSVYDPAPMADALTAMALAVCGDVIFIPNYHHRCYDAAFEAAARVQATGRQARVLGYCHSDAEYYYEMLRSFSPWLSGFVAVSRAIADTLYRQHAGRLGEVSILPYPTNLSEPRQPADGPLRLLYAGRLEETQKRVSRLVHLAKALQDRGVEVRFDICGDGPERQVTEASFREHVRQGPVSWCFTGALSPAEIRARLVSADVLVLVSGYEGYPLVIQEAMSVGVCPVVMQVSGIDELIETGRSGWIVAQDDAVEMAKIIQRLSDDRSLLERCSAGARQRILSERSVPAFLKEFGRIMDAALRRPAPDFPRVGFVVPSAMAQAVTEFAEGIVARRPGVVAVYGAGIWGRALIRALGARGISPRFLVDSNPALWGITIEHLVCSRPASLPETSCDFIAVASRAFSREIHSRIAAVYAEAGCRLPDTLTAP